MLNDVEFINKIIRYNSKILESEKFHDIIISTLFCFIGLVKDKEYKGEHLL